MFNNLPTTSPPYQLSQSLHWGQASRRERRKEEKRVKSSGCCGWWAESDGHGLLSYHVKDLDPFLHVSAKAKYKQMEHGSKVKASIFCIFFSDRYLFDNISLVSDGKLVLNQEFWGRSFSFYSLSALMLTSYGSSVQLHLKDTMLVLGAVEQSRKCGLHSSILCRIVCRFECRKDVRTDAHVIHENSLHSQSK